MKGLLQEDARYRDNDTLLLNRVHNDEIIAQGFSPIRMSVYIYWQWMVSGKLSDEATIKRCRRKVQQECIELRGQKYHERNGQQLDVVKALQELP